VILRHRLLKSQLGLPCLIGAVAVADAIHECTGLSTKIKWPNDVHINGKKVAGLLAELEYDHRQQPFLVLGFGVNVDIENFPISLKQTATSLKVESGKTWCRITLLGAILRGIEKHYFDLKSNQTKHLIEKANQLCTILGQEIKIQTSEETFSGTAERIDEDGGLLLSQESEKNRKILIGEVVKTSR
jgi:BirA family biotin operon repressor/biotin-[acetyl-CoA-carboxylase] ligase